LVCRIGFAVAVFVVEVTQVDLPDRAGSSNALFGPSQTRLGPPGTQHPSGRYGAAAELTRRSARPPYVNVPMERLPSGFGTHDRGLLPPTAAWA